MQETKPKQLSFRMAVLATVFFQTNDKHDAVPVHQILDAINKEAAQGNCQPMTLKQVSDALANLKLLGCLISRPDPEQHQGHLWSVTKLGGQCIDENGFAKAYEILRAKDPNALKTTQPKVVDSTPASEIFAPSPLPRRRSKPVAPQVTASVVFSFNGVKYTLPLEVIKAIKEFTL